MKIKESILLGGIILLALIFRLIPINFPTFTADEARISYRGYTLATRGSDELGRKYPLIFNSLEDYQLPLISYITSVGIGLFGKSEAGARLPFIFIGTTVVWLTFLIASVFNTKYNFRLIVALITAFSPVLIFFSKTPNEIIVLIFLLLLIFYLLTRKNINLLATFTIIVLSLLTTKISWFILFPFVVCTLFFYQDNLLKIGKILICVGCLLLTILTIGFFLKIPQSFRSLTENNFPIFSNITIKNGINSLRGQGIQSGWPAPIEKLLFNKLHFLSVGFLHWISGLQISIFFSQFDKTGQWGFLSMGAWSKVLIIPFIFGLINLIKKGDLRLKLLPGYFMILTIPLLSVYPKQVPNITAIVLPFMSILITLGLVNMQRWIRLAIILVMILEITINLIYLKPEIKNTNNLRPVWINKIITEGYIKSKTYNVAFSDDIADDVLSFFEWYTPITPTYDFPNIDFPYKFRQYKLSNIKILGHEDNFYNCGLDKPPIIFVSIRDFDKIQKDFQINIENTYFDSLGNKVVYQLKPAICIK